MYSTCLHCHHSLGANDAVEHFPVGRRLASDSAKGRLWVVCPDCGRWNLTPIDERWEAVEDCERLFAHQHLRAQTDNIGLVRLREGSELIAPVRRCARVRGVALRRCISQTVSQPSIRRRGGRNARRRWYRSGVRSARRRL